MYYFIRSFELLDLVLIKDILGDSFKLERSTSDDSSELAVPKTSFQVENGIKRQKTNVYSPIKDLFRPEQDFDDDIILSLDGFFDSLSTEYKSPENVSKIEKNKAAKSSKKIKSAKTNMASVVIAAVSQFTLKFDDYISNPDSKKSLIDGTISQVLCNKYPDILNMEVKLSTFNSEMSKKPSSSQQSTDLISALKCADYYNDQILSVINVPAQSPIFGELPRISNTAFKDNHYFENSSNLISKSSYLHASKQNMESPQNLKNDAFRLTIAILKDVFKIENFYSHQIKAFDAIANRNSNILISTNTASGKSIIFYFAILMSVLNRIKSQKHSQRRPTAMLVFPFKALSQNQFSVLTKLFSCPLVKENEFGLSIDDIVVDVFDGDTNSDLRRVIPSRVDVLITNPDSLHHSILPNFKKWHRFISNLSLVIVDGNNYFFSL
ncbi:putative ATP-dependent helicase HRQ1 [Smittium mucronatum]|uniref:Putative ATP-dependent helicase HRQ1 n=1 Tax=Smittium mucronatum TaxID=133383 RepID=A0A1R0GXC7_9FUNG|nr:putative ATP-dependent helicase HRQ1 [Smittium mucronatum]